MCINILNLNIPLINTQAAAEKSIKQLQSQLAETNARLEESNRTLNDFDVGKKKLAAENADLLRQLEEADNQINQLAKIRSSLTTQLDDNKKMAEEESRVRESRNTPVFCSWL